MPQPERVQNGVRWGLQDPRLEYDIKWWFVQAYVDRNWVGRALLPTETKQYAVDKNCQALAIRSVSQSGLTSDPVVVRLK